MKTLILSIITIALFQGCDLTDPTCHAQQCTNGVMTFKLCNRSGNQNIILTDESGKSIIMQSKQGLIK